MRTLFHALLLLAAATMLSAADSPQAPAPQLHAQPGEAQELPEPSVMELERQALLRDLRIQRNDEFEAVFSAEKLRVEALQAQLLASKSPSEQLALHRAIERAKFDTRLQILDIQARYADLAGNAELATGIREEIRRMKDLDESRQPAIGN